VVDTSELVIIAYHSQRIAKEWRGDSWSSGGGEEGGVDSLLERRC